MLSSSGPSTGQTCGLVLIFAVLLQSICVAITFLYFTNELQQLRDTYSKSGFACLTRDNFNLEDLDPNYNEDSDPCWQVRWQLSRLIKKMISRQQMEEGSSSSKGTLLGNGLGFKINTWEPSRRAHSFLYNVELSNGELIIPQTGFYYIYSQTYFRFREPENSEFDPNPGSDSVLNPKQMVQFISKYTNYPDPILLMKSARTSCWSKKAGYGLYSIYQGGVFQLKSHDRIFVSISNEDLVDLDKEASFFGAFLIS
ncbi:hypothetical protein lerEdw1_016985 [Lerista edwardsae]|nr:hypothetical protein lerEdw1_016985 [Lerista edwardsae]